VSIDGPLERRYLIHAAGAFDLSNRRILCDAICAAAGNAPTVIEIDLGAVRFMDAGVIRVLMGHRDQLHDIGCALRVVNANGLPARVLDLTRTRTDLCG
jgi:anti-anti-sigma factor